MQGIQYNLIEFNFEQSFAAFYAAMTPFGLYSPD